MNNEQKCALSRFFEVNPSLVTDSGCYIGAGREPAVLDALIKLQALSADTGVEIKIRQIKEKFGGLRLYLDVTEDSVKGLTVLAQTESNVRLGSTATPGYVRDRAYAIVREAEEVTGKLCESCGAPTPEMSTLGGFITRRCTACIAAREATAQVLHEQRRSGNS